MQWEGVYFYTPRMGYCRSMSNHLSKAVTHDQSHNVLGTEKMRDRNELARLLLRPSGRECLQIGLSQGTKLALKKRKTEKLVWGVHFFKKEHHPKNNATAGSCSVHGLAVKRFTRLDQGFLVLPSLSGRSNKGVGVKCDLVFFAKRRTVRIICNKLLEQDLCFSSINDHQESKVR